MDWRTAAPIKNSVLPKGFWDFWSLSHPNFPPGRIRTNKLEELRTQNKRSSIQEQLTGDPGGQPKRQWTKGLRGHLHLGAVPGNFGSCLWVPSRCQMVKWRNQNNLEMSLLFFIQGKTIHGLGKYSASQTVERSSQGVLGNSEFYLEVATWKQGMIGWEVGDFLIRLVGPKF